MNNISLERPVAIIFDWDNTLVDSWHIIHDALNHTLQVYDKEPWTLEETRARVRKSMRDSFPGLFGDHWQLAADTFYERFDAIHMKNLEPLPWAGQMLEELAGQGIYLSVVSNKRGPYIRQEAEHLGWNRHFGHIIGALDASNDKPSPEPVDLALAGSGHQRGRQVWFVGDADIDMECAHNAGLTPILLRTEPPNKGEFSNYQPACHINNCQSLCKLVKEM